MVWCMRKNEFINETVDEIKIAYSMTRFLKVSHTLRHYTDDDSEGRWLHVEGVVYGKL
jgi:hypothetical protein